MRSYQSCRKQRLGLDRDTGAIVKIKDFKNGKMLWQNGGSKLTC